MLKATLYIILLLTSTIGIRRWHKLSPPFRWLNGFVWLNILILAGSYWAALEHANNLPVFHIYNVLAPIVAGAYFYAWVKRKKPIMLLSGVSSVFALLNALWIQGWTSFPTTSNAVNGILFSAICMMAYLDILHHHIAAPGWKNDLLLTTTAFFIYFSTMGIIWGPYNIALTRVVDYGIFHLINACINLLVFLLFGYSIYLNTRRAEH